MAGLTPFFHFRLSVKSANSSDVDDDYWSDCDSVFSDGDENGGLLSKSPPSPAPGWDAGFCLDSPTRCSLQRDSSTLPSNIKKLGKGGFGTVVLRKWQVNLFFDTFSVVFRALLHASTMLQTIPDIHGYSQIFPVSESF